MRTRALAALLATSLSVLYAAQPLADPGIAGRVLSHDGLPVSGGKVTLRTSLTSHVDASIDDTGHFRVVPDNAANGQLFISVPGHAPYRATIVVPSSRTMALPDVTLAEATYFQARFTSPDGEQLDAGGLRLRSIDVDGLPIMDPLGHVQQRTERDGTLTIGPLPAGRTLLAFDRPGLAQTRLRDINVTADRGIIDGGTITINRGASLHVDAVDAKGAAVAQHPVWLEDASQPSPLSFPVQRTNDDGRATFDRLAPGRYRVSTQTVDRCGPQPLPTSRLTTVPSTGASRVRLVIDGRAAIRVTSAIGPMLGRSVTVSPDVPGTAPWQPRLLETMGRGGTPVPRSAAASCGAVTNNNGRVTLTPFPPGPAIVRVRLFNSTWVTRVSVPEGSGEIVLSVPDGLIPVRVTNRVDQSPVNARITWNANGTEVEASTTANGDALLEAVGATGGTMSISAPDFQPVEGAFAETPDSLQEIALVPLPSSRLTVHVVDERGYPVSIATVQLHPRGAADAPVFASANANGGASFFNLPDGPLQFSAHAEGFKPATVRMVEDARAAIMIRLVRVQ